MSKQRIGWLGMTAIGFGGACLSIYTMSSLLVGQGTITLPLMALGFLISIFSSIGYLELVLMYPKKIGGITNACADIFKPYNPIFSNLAGTSYWFAWLTATSFAAQYLASIVQPMFFPSISVNLLATGLIIAVTAVCLMGLRCVQWVIVPLALAVLIMAVATVIVPIEVGQVNWATATNFQLIQTIPTDFGALTNIMACLYLIGWSVPAYECVLCYLGETDAPKKNAIYALFIAMAVTGLFFVVAPLIWLGVIGPTGLSKDLSQELWPVFAPIFGSFSKTANVFFVIFIMILCIFTPLLGPPRTLAQLSHDGLVPEFFGKMTKAGIPRNATLVTAAIAIGILWMGTPLWIIAATSFQYLLCISMASIAVWLLRIRAPQMTRLFRAPTVFIYLGIFSAAVWMLATILGFQQYGLTTMIIGIVFAFIGTPLYLWRKITDRIAAKLPPLPSSLHIKLTGTMLAVLAFDVIGYLIAVNSLKESDPHLNMLEDIFVIVALIAITVGLALPGMIVHAAEEINRATKRLIKTNLFDLSQAMEELGAGSLKQKKIKSDIIPIEIRSRDEIGEMAFSFNEMQEEIQKTANSFNEVRQRLYSTLGELKSLNETLEKRVNERTQALDDSNKKLQNEINERIKMEKKVKKIHNHLVVAARYAGMADIAKSTLHNIGNILNSINTSVTMLNQHLKNSEIDSLDQLSTLIKEHTDNIDNFILHDEKGQLIPSYICALADNWQKDKKTFFDELDSLQNNIDHVRDIINMQQGLSRAVGIAEEISIDELVDDAWALKKDENKSVVISKELNQSKTIITDRVKLLQVIVNIINNAFEALENAAVSNKKLNVSLLEESDHFIIQIKDNGVGISSLNLKKIFTYGFTTKKTGHGLGLHSSVLEVKELGGTLEVKSEGEGQGATFIITLPYVYKKEKLPAEVE